MSERAAVIVLGTGIGGLAAAAYAARQGLHTLILEARDRPREPAEALIALDPRMMSELQLAARGLRLTAEDLPLAIAGETPLLLGRDHHAASCALAKFSDADALAWPFYSRALMNEGRRLRRWWWAMQDDERPDAAWSVGARREFRRLCLTGADAYLGQRFETPALLAALLWDAGAGGFHVGEPGSALALVWRAAQEMAGLQGAAAIARPGSLVSALSDAMGMAQLRTRSRVTAIHAQAGGVTGVSLADGSHIEADHVVSTLSRAQTLRLAGLPDKAPPIAQLQMLLRLTSGFHPPEGPATRHILASQPDVHAAAHDAARGGLVAPDVPMEWVVLDADSIAVTARPVPAHLSTEDRVRLAAQLVLALSRDIPGLSRNLAGLELRIQPQRARLADLLMPPASRILTPIHGLLLAGEDAEPLPAISGRAGRLAAQWILSR